MSSERKQISLAFLALLLVGANDGAIGVLIPALSTHYHLDNARVGLLFPFEALGFLITAFQNGFLMSRLGVRRYLLLGAGIFLTSTVILALTPPFFIVLLVLLLLGCGAASLDVGLNTYIARLPGNVALLNYLHAMWGSRSATWPSGRIYTSPQWKRVELGVSGLGNNEPCPVGWLRVVFS